MLGLGGDGNNVISMKTCPFPEFFGVSFAVAAKNFINFLIETTISINSIAWPSPLISCLDLGNLYGGRGAQGLHSLSQS